MGLKDVLEQISTLEGRRLEDEIYKAVWYEISQGQLDPSAQARALADGGNSKEQLQSSYIKHRIRMLKDELRQLKLEEKQRQQEFSRTMFDALGPDVQKHDDNSMLPEGFDEDLAVASDLNPTKNGGLKRIVAFCVISLLLVSIWSSLEVPLVS